MSDLTSPDSAPVHTLRMHVYYEDTDAGGIVYYANYLKFIERARSDWLRAHGLSNARIADEHGHIVVVRAVEADYLRPGRLDDELEVDVRVLERRRTSVRLAQSVRRVGDDGGPLMTAVVRLVGVNLGSGRPEPFPDALGALFEPR